MITTMYERRMKAAFWASLAVLLVGIVLMMVDWPSSPDDWMNVSMIGFTAFALLIAAFVSRQKVHQIQNIPIPESDSHIDDLNHLVIKRDPGFFPRLLLFEKNGQYAGAVKPQHVPILLYPLGFLFRDSAVMLLPVTYGVYQPNGDLLFTLRRKGLKRSIVTVKDAEEKQLGIYVQEDFKSLSKIRGVLKDAEGQELLKTEVKGFSGDFSLTGTDGKNWARFDNGFFPHEYTDLFQDMDNDIVYISEDLPAEKKQLLLALVLFLFLERSK